MTRFLATRTVVLALLFALPETATADITFNFIKIADTNTIAPGGATRFDDFDEPSLSDGMVVFRGAPLGRSGIFASVGGTLQVVADNATTTLPGGTDRFAFFGPHVSVSGGTVAFRGSGLTTPPAYFTATGGTLQLAVSRDTPIPGGTGNFQLLSSTPSLSGNDLVFRAQGAANQEGVYGRLGGTLRVLADTNTPIPGGVGNFTQPNALAPAFGFLPALSGQNVAFHGFGSAGQDGIYASIGGSLRVVADTRTPIPGGTGTFFAFLGPVISGEAVAFIGFSADGQTGIYLSRGGSLQVVADTRTLIPGTTRPFSDFGFDETESFLSLSDGNLAFIGYEANGGQGIYTTLGGSLMKVIDLNSQLDGKIPGLFLGFRDGMSGNAIAFRVGFEGGSQGIFVAEGESAPEPSSLVLLSIGVLGLLGYGCRRWHRPRS